MDHTSWTARDGAPQGIRALAQGPDGTLWIGSEVGLYSFDGRGFTAFRSPPGSPQVPVEPIYSLCFSMDGALWVGFLQAGAARIANGHVMLYSSLKDEPLGLVHDLTPAADGSVWAISQHSKLVRVGPDLAWHEETSPVPGKRIGNLLIDSSNTLWVPQGARLYRRPLAQAEYTATDVEVDLAFGFAEAKDGSTWVTEAVTGPGYGRTQHVDRHGRLLATLPALEYPFDILHARDGSVILALQNGGLRRFSGEDLARTDTSQQGLPVDRITSAEGLTSDVIYTILQDADGNIWAGGRRGLDRLRRATLIPFVADPPAPQWVLCADKRGTLWMSGLGPKTYRSSGDRPVALPYELGAYALYCAADGDVWLTNHVGIWRLYADRIEEVPNVPGATPYAVKHLAATSYDTLYAAVGGSTIGGLWEYRNAQWTRIPGDGVLGKSGWIQFVDSQDRLWVGHRDGVVTLPLESRILPTGDPGVGLVRALLETSRGMVAAGTNGIAVLHGENFQMLKFEDEATVRGIWAVVETRGGDFWMNASRGIIRASASEIDAALEKPGHRIKIDLLREGGFTGASAGTGHWANAAEDANGRLWFATLNGIVSVDPANWRAESRPPTVTIRSVTADRQPLDVSATIGPRFRTLEVRYLGVNLTAPEKVIYRYRLDGFDEAWRDVGNRTEAVYTGLPAGKYTFRVMASNGDGVWTVPVSTEAITILPSFYQTTWFAVLSILVVLAVLWFAYQMRVRTITREVRARAEERADERIRIARELHDTLLQGIQGLLLTFHVASQKVAADAESKSMLERALAAADRIIIEGRNRVSRLRTERLSDSELVSSLEAVCADLQGAELVECSITRHGESASLFTHVAEEVFYVAREALTNAFRHSQAQHVALTLTYGKRYFTLRCRDDGRGFDAAGLDRHGHWGLQGMTERAQKLGGTLSCISSPGQGTEIQVSIPSYRAYPNQSRAMFYLRALMSNRHQRAISRDVSRSHH